MANYGKPIKDPSILSELNGSVPSYGAPIKDNETLSQLEETPHSNFLKKIAEYIPDFGSNVPLNISSGIMSLAFRNPEQARMVANLPQTLQERAPTKVEDFEHSVGKNLPSIFAPELKGAGFIPEALSRIGGQTVLGAAMNQGDSLEGAKEFGLGQLAMEGVGGAARPLSWLAEKVNPIKYAGKVAETIRNLAQKGYKEGEKEYRPVHSLYDENLVTTTPEKYLGFHPEDRQYFKPDVNKAYRDFLAEPNFKNLHSLQSEMGKHEILYPMRKNVKEKIESYLSQDKPMLSKYKKGSDILKENYYPYVNNDVLKDIVEHQTPIESFDPHQLSKALENSELVEKFRKSKDKTAHPLIEQAENLRNAMSKGQMYQYLLPATLGTLGGYYIDPSYGPIGGALAGAIAGKFGEPQLLKLAQNPVFLDKMKALEKMFHGAGRQAIGYNMY